MSRVADSWQCKYACLSTCLPGRHHAELERSIARAGDECDARADDVTALLSQLKHAEQAALAAQGEAAALRSQLLQVEALLAAKHEEAQQMKQTLNTTIARSACMRLPNPAGNAADEAS